MTTPVHWMTAPGSSTVLFPFLTLQGSLVPIQPQFERETRPGVNGIGIWNMGTRGEPFGISTNLDCNSETAAGLAFKAYQAAVGSRKDLYYGSKLWSTVFIHKVILTEMKKLQTRVGGIQNATGQAGAMLIVQWTIESLYPS